MSIIDTSVILIACLFGIYGLASAVECGIVLKMLVRGEHQRKMFTPLWEITNVYLVFGITALVMLFNNALSRLSHDLLATVGVALVAMLTRACLVLGIFYMKENPHVPAWLLWPFATATFLVPLTFAAAGIYLVTGQAFYESWIGSLLELAALVGLAGSGLVFINRREIDKRLLPGELVLAVWFLILGSILPLVATHTASRLAQLPLLGFEVLSGLGLMLILARSMGFKKIRLWQYAGAMCILTPILLAWANRPFLISGKLSLAASFGAQTYASAVIIGSIVMLPLIILGSWLFGRLLRPAG